MYVTQIRELDSKLVVSDGSYIAQWVTEDLPTFSSHVKLLHTNGGYIAGVSYKGYRFAKTLEETPQNSFMTLRYPATDVTSAYKSAKVNTLMLYTTSILMEFSGIFLFVVL